MTIIDGKRATPGIQESECPMFRSNIGELTGFSITPEDAPILGRMHAAYLDIVKGTKLSTLTKEQREAVALTGYPSTVEAGIGALAAFGILYLGRNTHFVPIDQLVSYITANTPQPQPQSNEKSDGPVLGDVEHMVVNVLSTLCAALPKRAPAPE